MTMIFCIAIYQPIVMPYQAGLLPWYIIPEASVISGLIYVDHHNKVIYANQ